MPANKNALIRYKTIDQCLRNPYRRWTLEDLVEACSDALYEAEGITKGVSLRTVQGDIQIMRSDKLGYNAPIEVYDTKYYRYADEDYSIMNMPLSQNDCEVMQEAIDLLRQLGDFAQFSEMSDVISRLQDKLAISQHQHAPIIHFDSVPNLIGIRLLNPLYNYIAHKQTLRVLYQPFNAKEPLEFLLYPYLLKEFRNRWFLFGSVVSDLTLYNLPLDRIKQVEPIDLPFRENPAFDSSHFFDDVIGVSKNLNHRPRTIRFWANAEQSHYIKTKPIHPSQRLIKDNPEDGSSVFQIQVVLNFEMYSVFLSYGPGLKVIHPQKVMLQMRDRLKEALALYDNCPAPTVPTQEDK